MERKCSGRGLVKIVIPTRYTRPSKNRPTRKAVSSGASVNQELMISAETARGPSELSGRRFATLNDGKKRNQIQVSRALSRSDRFCRLPSALNALTTVRNVGSGADTFRK